MRSLIILAVGLFSAFSHAEKSVYTSVKVDDCITINSSDFDEVPEIDYYTGICRGQGPYVVKISGGDIRYSLSLLFRGEEINGLTKTIAFHDLGSDVVEWRYNNNDQLKALIFRINADGDGQNMDMLHVVKIDGMNTCTVAVLINEPNSNVKARNIADNISGYSCM